MQPIWVTAPRSVIAVAAAQSIGSTPVRLVVAIVLAVASYYVIEGPSRRFLNRLTAHRSTRKRPE